MELATLDLSHFTRGTETERKKLASDLLTALSQHGFVKLINHGVSEQMITNLWKLSEAFFKMEPHKKDEIAHVPGPNPQRGWSKIGAESSSRLYNEGLLQSKVKEDLRDAREHWDQGAKSDIQFPNIWPAESALPNFRSSMEDAFDVLEGVSTSIMEVLEVSFDLPRGTFLDKISHEKNASEFRLNHYPAIEVAEIKGGQVSRIWPHFDLGVITLLFQDSVGGLEIENRYLEGSFYNVECGSKSEMIVNVSETLQRWTNDSLLAGLHRVGLPLSLDANHCGIVPERYSMAYFCKANRDASVGPLKPFVHPDSMSVYQEMTAIEYQKIRLESAY